MPGRYFREGLLDSERMRRAGEPAEILFVHLSLVVDDWGRFDGRIPIITNRCWPLGGHAEEDTEARLAALTREGIAVRYEVAGKPYVFIPNFKQRTRATASKWPDPPTIDGQVPDNPPTNGSQPSGRWQTHDSHPQAVSLSGSLSISGSDSSRGQLSAEPYTAPRASSLPPQQDKSTSKPPTSPTNPVEATKARITEQAEWTKTATPMPEHVRAAMKHLGKHASPPAENQDAEPPAAPQAPQQEPGDIPY